METPQTYFERAQILRFVFSGVATAMISKDGRHPRRVNEAHQRR